MYYIAPQAGWGFAVQLSSGPEVLGLLCGPGERTIIHSSPPISIQPISKRSEAGLAKQLACPARH